MLDTLSEIDGYPNSFAALWDIEQDTLYNLNARFTDLLTTSPKFTAAAAISGDNRYIVGSGYNGETNRTEGFLLDTYAPSSTKKDAASPFISVFPNPFHHSTSIRVLLTQSAMVTIQTADILGNLIYVSGEHSPTGYAENLVGWDSQQLPSPAEWCIHLQSIAKRPPSLYDNAIYQSMKQQNITVCNAIRSRSTTVSS